MIRRGLFLLPLLAAACGNGTAIPDLDAPRITAGVSEVELGRAFPLTVVRTRAKEETAAEWNAAALAPLSVRLLETKRREDDRRVEETRRYEAYAFSLEDLSEPVALRVTRALDPERPGPAELPGGPLATPFPWLPWSFAAAVALGALFLLVRLRRRRPAPPAAPPPEPRPGPHVRALERIGQLRTEPDVERFFVEAAALLREYAGERFEVRAREMTTEQLTAAVGDARLEEALRSCDLVKFARFAPDASERARVLDRAEAFVRGTSA